MFEVGKEYDFSESWAGETSTWRGKVLATEGTLLKLQKDGIEIIFNTASSSFSEAREFDLAKLSDLSIDFRTLPPPKG